MALLIARGISHFCAVLVVAREQLLGRAIYEWREIYLFRKVD